VLPLAVDKCAVVFDYYFADVSKKAAKKNQAPGQHQGQRKSAGGR